MKYFLFMALMMSCFSACSQSHDIAGEYEKITKSGSFQYLLKINPNGTFHFDSYNQIGGKLFIKEKLPAEPSISGRGKWRAENDVIYFTTNPDMDIDYSSTLNFNNTKAKFINESSEDLSNEKVIAKLEFFESGIFWINRMELKKRN